jgi:hypothetical protein
VSIVDLIQSASIGVVFVLSLRSLIICRRMADEPDELSQKISRLRLDRPLEKTLAELLEKSRAGGGRVHIHDVEEVFRRNLE